MTCAAQLDTRFMSYIESINLRRVWIADEEKGLVFGLSMFHHPMNEKVLRDRKIHEIEASGAVLPFNSKNGWSDFLR
jgi:hypothetical protein